jgi:hypothetical protein
VLKPLAIVASLSILASPMVMPALAAAPDCVSADLVKSTIVPLAVCVDPAVWEKVDAATGQEFVYFTKDQTAGFAIVTEKPSVALPAFHDGILAYAEKLSGAAAGSIKSYDDATLIVSGKSWGAMHYNATMQGNQIEFLDYYYSEDGLGAIQLLFWSAPADAGKITDDLAPKLISSVLLNP